MPSPLRITFRRFSLLPTAILLLLNAFIASDAQPASADSSWHRFQLGYDRGISCRYFPARNWGLGLIASTSSFGPLYEKVNEQTEYRDQMRNSTQNNRSNEKSASLTVEALRGFKLKGMFIMHAFVSAGGSFSSYRYDRTYTSIYDAYMPVSDSMAILRPASYTESQTSDQTDLGIFGRIGIMPGISWGSFSAALRLGIEGRITRSTSPDDASRKLKQNYSSVRFIYPMNFVQELVLHFEI